MSDERKSLEDFPKVYGYVPFRDTKDAYELYDIGVTVSKGKPVYVTSHSESVSLEKEGIQICASLKEVHQRYFDDVKKIKSLRRFIHAYQANYIGDDKFLPDELGKEPLGYLESKLVINKREKDTYQRAFNALRTGFFEVTPEYYGKTLYPVKDVVYISSCNKEMEAVTKLAVTLENPNRTIYLHDDKDISLMRVLFSHVLLPPPNANDDIL